jgi:hypothetical protein
MKSFKITLVVLAVMLLAASALLRRPALPSEAFSAAPATCPTAAIRNAAGGIRLEPSGRVVSSMKEYVAYLNELYAAGAQCIPPPVHAGPREPIAGMLGGLGVGAPSPTEVEMEQSVREPSGPSAGTSIQKLDDYEYSRVFTTESSQRKQAAPDIAKKLSTRALDWASLPFDSEEAARQQDEFVAGRLDNVYRDPASGVFFKTMEGETVQPPDEVAEREREQKVLSAYRPTSITKHTIDAETETVGELVHKLYESDPNWEPVLEKTGENTYQITELRPKPRKERYADAQTTTLAMAEASGDYVPPEPVINIEDRIRGDPYFQKNGVADRENDRFWNYNDFNKWTPGLERMFAPTQDTREWY